MLQIPETPKEILVNEHNTQEAQIMSEGNPIFFVERTEYPEEGGVLVYKFGGRLKPMDLRPKDYEEKGLRLQKELEELLLRYDFSLMGQDRKQVLLMPTEVLRMEDKQMDQIENRVDLLYPEKGFPDPLATSLANQAKRTLKIAIDFFSYKWTIIAFFPFLFLPYKYKLKIIQRWIEGWTGWAMTMSQPRRMKPKYYCTFSRELMKFMEVFLTELGIAKEWAYRTAWMFAEISERDQAYRWRIQDLLTETSKYALMIPSQELPRLLKLFLEREKKSAKLPATFIRFFKFGLLLLKHPRIKRALWKALESTTFTNFQFDDADKYHVSRFAGYEFFGIPYEARKQAYNTMHKGNPPEFGYIKI